MWAGAAAAGLGALAPGPAAAQWVDVKLPDGDFAVGPSVAYVSTGTDHGVAVNLDAATTAGLFSTSLDLQIISAGGQTLGGPKFELTVWLLANVGGGIGCLAGDDVHFVSHLFIGLPLPAGPPLERWARPFRGTFTEPYYRLNALHDRAGRDRTFHELGVFLKASTWDP